MITADKAMVHSAFERNDKDRYFTDKWVTKALLRRLDVERHRVWEPACGRGDIVEVLKFEQNCEVFASDIDVSELETWMCDDHGVMNFLEQKTVPPFTDLADDQIAIITNPPYDKAEQFIRHALSFKNVRHVAMLLRSEFNQAKSRVDLWQPPFAFEVALTSRPRWDWWFTEEEKRARRIKAKLDPDKPDASPRHNFSWFVWDRCWEGHSTQFWEGKKEA